VYNRSINRKNLEDVIIVKCPYCNGEESKVVDSRATEDDGAIRRRRECLNCNKRYNN